MTKKKGKRVRKQPPRDGCGGVRDYWGEFDCTYAPPFDCEECMYGPRGKGKNPQAAKYHEAQEARSNAPT